MTQNNDENLLHPKKPLTLDMVTRFMEKNKEYYALKRDLNPKGNIIQPQNSAVLSQQIASTRE